jgi:hypothetical protein
MIGGTDVVGSVIMIEPKQSDIGRNVIYRYRVHSNAKAEEGVITRFNEKYVWSGRGRASACMAPQSSLPRDVDLAQWPLLVLL